MGLGLILTGIFVTDAAQGYPPGTPEGPAVTTTWHGLLHVFTGAFPVFGALPLACFVMARTFSGKAGGRGWVLISLAAGLAMWGCFAGFIAAGLGGGPAGLYERISLSAGFGWVALLAARLLLGRAQ